MLEKAKLKKRLEQLLDWYILFKTLINYNIELVHHNYLI
jgi:hypothetical protein